MTAARLTAMRWSLPDLLEIAAAWLLAIIWISPLAYAFWAAFHAGEYAIHFDLFAPLTLENFQEALAQAPFLRYAINTFILVTMLLSAQLVVCTLAAYAFARFEFAGSNIAFALVLVQLMITPEILIVENYATLATMSLVDTILGIGLPYMASAFGIFLLRQAFKSTPKELEEAARLEGCGLFSILWRVYIPLAKPTYLAYGLVSISHHWNNFLWPLVITNSVETRPLTVGLGHLRRTGIRCGLVHHLCSHAPVRGAAADCLSAVPASVHSVLHACGHQMTRILSWNIQNGIGIDGRVSLPRVARVIEEMGPVDVICLQEVSRGLELPGGTAPDQIAELDDLFPQYDAIFGAAVDSDPEEKRPALAVWQPQLKPAPRSGRPASCLATAPGFRSQTHDPAGLRADGYDRRRAAPRCQYAP